LAVEPLVKSNIRQ